MPLLVRFLTFQDRPAETLGHLFYEWNICEGISEWGHSLSTISLVSIYAVGSFHMVPSFICSPQPWGFCLEKGLCAFAAKSQTHLFLILIPIERPMWSALLSVFALFKFTPSLLQGICWWKTCTVYGYVDKKHMCYFFLLQFSLRHAGLMLYCPVHFPRF